MTFKDIPYGPVKIIGGSSAERIGYYDDEDYLERSPGKRAEAAAIVYFGDPFVASGYHLIPARHIRPVTTDDLIQRREELHGLCGAFAKIKNPTVKLKQSEKFNYLAELHYVDSVLLDRIVDARYSKSSKGAQLFISHSSKDKVSARWIGTDLKAAGHTPWFDEWDIHVGEFIPQKVSDGLKNSDFLILLLSEHALSSKWVEREWQTKYWSEIERDNIQVLPVLLRDCELPELLKTKKYADFRNSYNDGLEDLLATINTFTNSAD